MPLYKLQHALIWAGLVCTATAFAIVGMSNQMIRSYKRAPLQDLVTWDEHSIFVHGHRIMLFSGEFHPFRLPVPSLWLDVFQKLKAAGFSGASFYADWALLEGKEGNFTAEGVFDFGPFFEAAMEAGIYLVARPGPYINAEVSGGGFPGWLARYRAVDRAPEYIGLTQNYVKGISNIIAKAQITNGGPVILVQPENEYTYGEPKIDFPDHDYMQAVEDQYRSNGIVVPFVSNDAGPDGNFAASTGEGSVDIYGFDGYPLGFDCGNPTTWPSGKILGNYLQSHLSQSPSTPPTISEFQGGSFDPWGGQGWDKCVALLNAEFERVFYKNNYAFGLTIFNIYMAYGGTNWGNLGHPGGYSSYDYGAIIAEDRTVTRGKYSELKLQTNFFKVSPSYLTSTPEANADYKYASTGDITITRVKSNTTNIFVARQSIYSLFGSTDYKLRVPTSQGEITIPQLKGSLTINGRDSKLHVTDYNVGGVNMLYSSAEIFTWKSYGYKTVLVLYGGPNELHEAAFVGQPRVSVIEGADATILTRHGNTIVNWEVSPERRVLKFSSGLYVYLLDRNDAYNYWVIDLPAASPVDNYTTTVTKSIIARAGYLLRTASVSGDELCLTGDINATTSIEVIGSPVIDCISFNGREVGTVKDNAGVLKGTVVYHAPNLTIPTLSSLRWKYVDSLPEIMSNYLDDGWVTANHKTTNNTVYNLTTPTSLFASDYGFNTGNLLTRGHFVSSGNETSLSIGTQGGWAYAVAVYLNSEFLQAWPGNAAKASYVQIITLPKLAAGERYVLTVLTDNMGLDEDYVSGADGNKNPRGILNYVLANRDASAITWKMAGNFGGEDYADRVRGPLNEGGLWAERQGYHLPGAPTSSWADRSPIADGIPTPGVGFFSATFTLDVPSGYDVPMSFVFSNSTRGAQTANFRVQLYVNGWQFGKYVNNIGPQRAFPVPEGILDYHGSNYVAVSLWGFDPGGNKLEGLNLVPTAKVMTGYGAVRRVPGGAWVERKEAY